MRSRSERDLWTPMSPTDEALSWPTEGEGPNRVTIVMDTSPPLRSLVLSPKATQGTVSGEDVDMGQTDANVGVEYAQDETMTSHNLTDESKQQIRLESEHNLEYTHQPTIAESYEAWLSRSLVNPAPRSYAASQSSSLQGGPSYGLSLMSTSPTTSTSNWAENAEKGRCPECGKFSKDIKAHILTHQQELPEKCPITTCAYHKRGFVRQYDKIRHTLTHYRGTLVCGFCPGPGTPAERTFNRTDVFKRHLTSVHYAEQHPSNHQVSISGSLEPVRYHLGSSGKCSTCSDTFKNAQEFYDHLDLCVLQVILRYAQQTENIQSSIQHKDSLHDSSEPEPEPETNPTAAKSSNTPSELQIEEGPLVFPVNMDFPQAIATAEEKRRRSLTASARFRARRKEKEQELSAKLAALQEEAEAIKRENEKLKKQVDSYQSLKAEPKPHFLPGHSQSLVGTNHKVLTPKSSNDLARSTSNSESEISFTDPILPGNHYELDCEAFRFSEQLARNIVNRVLQSHVQGVLRSHAGRQCKPSSSNSQKSDGGKCTNRQTESNKRPHQDEEESDDTLNDGRGSGPPEPKRTRNEESKPTRLLACPYSKFDPERYSERNQAEKCYRKCASKYLTNIARLKQHLYRTHMRPAWYCGNCYENFKKREEMNQHSRLRPPCSPRSTMYEEMMTDEQFREVKRRSQGNNDRESWYKVYQILFPGALQPSSPYVSTCNPEAVQHFVAFFRAFGSQEFFHLMRERQERNSGPSFHLETTTQAIVDEAFEIALPDYLEQLEQDRPHQTYQQGHLLTPEHNVYTPSSSLSTSTQEYLVDSIWNYHRPTQTERLVSVVPPLPNDTQDGRVALPQTAHYHRFPAAGNAVHDFVLTSGTQGQGLDTSVVDQAFDTYAVFTDVDFLSQQWNDPHDNHDNLR